MDLTFQDTFDISAWGGKLFKADPTRRFRRRPTPRRSPRSRRSRKPASRKSPNGSAPARTARGYLGRYSAICKEATKVMADQEKLTTTKLGTLAGKVEKLMSSKEMETFISIGKGSVKFMKFANMQGDSHGARSTRPDCYLRTLSRSGGGV